MFSKRGIILISLLVTLTILLISMATAFDFNGTIKRTDGTALGNATINITLRNSAFTVLGQNSTTTNSSGAFNLTVSEITNGFYQISTSSYNNSDYMTYMGSTLPPLPLTEVRNIAADMTFYLKRAGTFNITAINSSSSYIGFSYSIKDEKLGYPLKDYSATTQTNVIVPVQADRNYTITMFPNNSLPVGYVWNNFSSAANYNINTISSSNFNATSKWVHKEFNTTMTVTYVSGYINYTGVNSWKNFTVLPYLMEPGGIVSPTYSVMPKDMGQFRSTPVADNITTSGFYNITVPAAAEGLDVLLLATAFNTSQYYGLYRNITTTYGQAAVNSLNFSMTYLLGSGTNITQRNGTSAVNINTTTAAQTINIVNISNSTIGSFSGQVEVVADYSSLGAREVTFNYYLDGTGTSQVLPVLPNNTGIKEINVYSNSLAPKRTEKTVTQLMANQSNVTLKSFSPADIDGAVAAANLYMGLYTSNSSCDIPNPKDNCVLASTANMASANPMKNIFGGGKVSFRMGTGNISVHYVNVDMLASGPPEALFDDSTTDQTGSGSFSSALRFGSGGPKIYDYILVGFPYNEASLDESKEVNISVGLFYDENWNVIWNTTLNGSKAADLASNYSHYNAKQSEWQYLMYANNSCETSDTGISVTEPCVINKTFNQIWLRLPHFSGTGPSIAGQTVSSSSSSTTSTSTTVTAEGKGSEGEEEESEVEEDVTGSVVIKSPESDGFGEDEFPVDEYTSLDTFSDWTSLGSVHLEASEGEKFSFIFLNTLFEEETHQISIDSIDIESGLATITVRSEPQEITLAIGTGKEVDFEGDGVMDLNIILNDFTEDGKASLQIKKLSEWEERESYQDQAAPGINWKFFVALLISLTVIFGVIVIINSKKK